MNSLSVILGEECAEMLIKSGANVNAPMEVYRSLLKILKVLNAIH